MNYSAIVQFTGNFTAGAVVFGVANLQNKGNFLIPISIQFLVPALIIIGTPWLLESPRWLVKEGRIEQARVVLKSLRCPKTSEAAESVERELEEMNVANESDRQLEHHGSSIRALFNRQNRKRSLIIIGVQALQ
jgi:hypothetical protein